MYRTTLRFWLVFVLTILIIIALSGCGGGGDYQEPAPGANCFNYPADFVGPRQPCPAV